MSGHIANALLLMNNIATLLYAFSALIGSSALAVNAITKFRTAAAKMRAEAKTSATTKSSGFRFDILFFIMGLSGMVMGIGGLVWQLSQPDAAATSHLVVNTAMNLVNVFIGSLLVTSTTIKRYLA